MTNWVLGSVLVTASAKYIKIQIATFNQLNPQTKCLHPGAHYKQENGGTSSEQEITRNQRNFGNANSWGTTSSLEMNSDSGQERVRMASTWKGKVTRQDSMVETVEYTEYVMLPLASVQVVDPPFPSKMTTQTLTFNASLMSWANSVCFLLSGALDSASDSVDSGFPLLFPGLFISFCLGLLHLSICLFRSWLLYLW